MEPDISTLQRTGHFYFALTRKIRACGPIVVAGGGTRRLRRSSELFLPHTRTGLRLTRRTAGH